jgi:hypothetical protein
VLRRCAELMVAGMDPHSNANADREFLNAIIKPFTSKVSRGLSVGPCCARRLFPCGQASVVTQTREPRRVSPRNEPEVGRPWVLQAQIRPDSLPVDVSEGMEPYMVPSSMRVVRAYPTTYLIKNPITGGEGSAMLSSWLFALRRRIIVIVNCCMAHESCRGAASISWGSVSDISLRGVLLPLSNSGRRRGCLSTLVSLLSCAGRCSWS